MKAKGAMIVIIALKGEELHKAGLPSHYIEIRWVNARARCSLDEHEHRAGRAVERAASYGTCC